MLIGGDPGIGKSTLVLQTLATMSAAGVKALYVSGEESAVQVKLRSERLEVSGSSLMLLCETSLEKILKEAKAFKPEILVIGDLEGRVLSRYRICRLRNLSVGSSEKCGTYWLHCFIQAYHTWKVTL